MHESRNGDSGELSDETVSALARLAGIPVAAERLPVVAEMLRTLHAHARKLDAVDIDAVEPAIRFDAAWPEERS